MPPLRRPAVAAVVALLALAGCGDKPRAYDTNVEVLRIRPINRDPSTNEIRTVDVEVSFFDCPGEQRKTIRGDKAFAACILKQKVGDKLPVKLWYGRVSDDRYGNKIVKLGPCDRTPDPKDEASFEVVQDCEPVVVNGVDVGVHCDRRRSKALLAKCPWFKDR
jgi:hypothetical protein